MSITISADIENREQLFKRVAEVIARADVIYDIRSDIQSTEEKFYKMMIDSEFIPAVEILKNAGKTNGILASGFALSLDDGLEPIFESLKNAAAICQRGGSVGLNLSKLQAAGLVNDITDQTASGPVKYMNVFNAAVDSVLQDEPEEPPLMCMLRIDHPDIMEFIECKSLENRLSNIKTVVGITERFVLAAQSDIEYNLKDPVSGTVVATVNARTVLNKILDSIKATGEPELMFMDRVNRDNTSPIQGDIDTVCPYGDHPMLPNEACVCGVINMPKMLAERDGKYVIDVARLEATVNDAVHFLDNVIDISCYPTEDIAVTTKLTRKISLGLVGWAEMLIMMGIPYNSNQAAAIGERIMAMITEFGRDASELLAGSRGAFPLFGDSLIFDDVKQRNGSITSIFNSEEMAVLGECAMGIEPVEAFVAKCEYEGEEYFDIHPLLEKALRKEELLSGPLLEKIIEAGSVARTEELPEYIRNVFVSSQDVTLDQQIRLQEAFQKNTDSNVVKELYLTGDNSIEDAIVLALDNGCKSINVKLASLAEEAAEEPVMVEEEAHPDQVDEEPEIVNEQLEDEVIVEPEAEGFAEAEPEIEAIEEPDTEEANLVDADVESDTIISVNKLDAVNGVTEKIKVGAGGLHITVNYDGKGICEIVTNTVS